MSIYENNPIRYNEDGFSDNTNSPYTELNNVSTTLVDFNDSVIFLNGDIDENTLVDTIIKIRALLNYRNTEDYSGESNDPINLIINSNGGDVYELLGLIDYISGIQVKVNTICRGKAASSAAILLACGTGTRTASKHSTIMLHDSSADFGGKVPDIASGIDYIRKLEADINKLLETKTKKDAAWWKANTRTDLYLTASQALELGLIDSII
jgi:ATP-dependent Clp protease protease subunit